MYRIYIVEDDPGIAEGIKQQAKARSSAAKSSWKSCGKQKVLSMKTP